MKGRGPVVLVTGGNRGIGFEASRALAAKGARVLLGSRKHAEGERAAKLLSKVGSVTAVACDVDSPDSIAALKALVEGEFGALDVLVNNAGIYTQDGVLKASESEVARVLGTNVQGVWRLCRAFVPAMAARKKGRVVNVSSGMGALSSMSAGSAAYRVSKAALNALTLTLADEVRDSGVTVVSLCPGWVRTEMGGANAPRDPADAGRAVADAALFDNRTGAFLRDGKPIPW
ncbi:MAG: SDR family NAD(P)-dependent oxidoreductase [Elusimicrobia bacterium]|nr:SDR family NAD(P)-dependent oxidoreductase [Elusimicrobiota bacterium]